MDLRTIARTLGGDVAGRQVIAPGPGHGPRDRSLAIRLVPGAPDGFIVHSHAGDTWQACRDHVRQRLGLPEWHPGDGREQLRTVPQAHRDQWDFDAADTDTAVRPLTDDDRRRIARAREIWDEARSPRGTAAENYLQSRCLELGAFAGTVLRFHPRTPWRDETARRTIFIPCLIAAFRSIDDDGITGIHRIRVDRPEHWPRTERRMLGVVHRAAVKLAPAGDGLTIGEGVETCMAAMMLGLGPAWALGSVGAISFLPVLDGIEVLTLLQEAGEPSLRALRCCGRRWREAGRRVVLSRSEAGSDHNDLVMGAR